MATRKKRRYIRLSGTLEGLPLEHELQAKKQMARARKYLDAEGCENSIIALGFASQAAAEGVWVLDQELAENARKLQKKAALRVKSKCGCSR